jgi:predicted nucleotidyltransferase
MRQERLLQELTAKLRAAFGERVVSVVLYGSAAAGDHHARYSDLNILCVLSRVTTVEMRAAAMLRIVISHRELSLDRVYPSGK